MVYILTSVFFFLFSLVLWNEEKNKREGRTHLYLLMAIFWLILHDGLRWEIGTDWEPYYNLFTTLDSGGHADFGYMIVLRLFRLLSNNYTLFLICFVSLN